ncbi:MAG: cation transporter [Gammaproteobacteria bacterium]
MKKTIFEILKMNCVSEERLVRMALEQAEGIVRLDFDLADRRLSVLHDADPAHLLKLLAPLDLSARIAETSTPNETDVAAAVSPLASEGTTLKLLLTINATMFVVESTVGWLAESAGLIADSLDMFADAAVYGVSLYAVGKMTRLQARAARLSGYLQLFLALGALFEVVRRFLWGSDPEPPFMIGMAFLALVANVTCMALIAKHRQGGVHMRASWIFSTNDVIANVGVIVAGLLVTWTQSALPDLVVGAAIATVVLTGALRILKLSRLSARAAPKGLDI